jgi:hypothetical protein
LTGNLNEYPVLYRSLFKAGLQKQFIILVTFYLS